MLSSIFKKIIVATVFASALGSVNATPTLVNLNTFNNTLSYTATNIAGDFVDSLYFKADALKGANAILYGMDFEDNASVSYRYGVGDSYDVAQWFIKPTGISADADGFFLAEQAFPMLESGKTYWLELAGYITDGFYTVKVIPAEVPEPGSMALILAGLGAMGVIARRRKTTTDKIGA